MFEGTTSVEVALRYNSQVKVHEPWPFFIAQRPKSRWVVSCVYRNLDPNLLEETRELEALSLTICNGVVYMEEDDTSGTINFLINIEYAKIIL